VPGAPGSDEGDDAWQARAARHSCLKESKMASTPKSGNDKARSSGARGAANSGVKKASNAHAAQRQGEKASANKASGKRGSTGGEKKSTPSTK
jgi:hypothetical protein